MFCISPNLVNLDNAFTGVVRENSLSQHSWSLSGFFPGGTIPLSEIRIGETCYRLREPLRGEFLTADDFSCEFWVDEFSPSFIGKGLRARDAYRDWQDKVHEVFQDLYGKRPFEMDTKDLENWQILENTIDIVGYRNEAPILIRQIGKVYSARPSPRGIMWIDGNSEGVNLADWPSEFASYKPGQPFEADVEHDPLTWKMRKVRFVRRIGPVQSMSPGELQKFWQSLRSTNSLTVSTRNWTET